MSNHVTTDTANTADLTGDPRVKALAEFTGLEPAEVIGHVREDATADGETVDAELDQDAAIAAMASALDVDDESDNDL